MEAETTLEVEVEAFDAEAKRAVMDRSEEIAAQVKAALDRITAGFGEGEMPPLHEGFGEINPDGAQVWAAKGADLRRRKRRLADFREPFEREEVDVEEMVELTGWGAGDGAAAFGWGANDPDCAGRVSVVVWASGQIRVNTERGCYSNVTCIDGDPDDLYDALRVAVLVAFAGILQVDGWT